MTLKNLTNKVIRPYQTYKVPSYIDQGTHGVVYKISNYDIAKIPRSLLNIGREMKIAQMLFESRISVPEPRAWDYVSVLQDYDAMQKAFIMEFIKGILCCDLMTGKPKDEKRFALAERLMQREIRKAQKLGFIPGKDYFISDNSIFTQDNKIKLLDFSKWRHPDVPFYVDPESVFRRQI